MDAPLPIGRVHGFRGREGEITVRVASGEAGRWLGLHIVLVAPAGEGEGEPAIAHEVERARGYRDRLVLKLKGIDDPNAAETLRGRLVLAPPGEVPRLPEGVHYVARLVGMEVRDERGETIGSVTDVVPTGGVDLLAVKDPGGEEVLVPLAKSIVLEIAETEGRITVRLPEGLREGGVE